MFVWTGINIEDQLPELKLIKNEIEEKLGIIDTVVNLPLHISLKISFEVADDVYPDVIGAVLDFYKTLLPITIEAQGIEREGGIVWLTFKENEKIADVHNRLTSLMQERFGIPPHKFDLEFKYHTTLFLGLMEDKLAAAYELVKNAPIPSVITLDNPVIGTSESGLAGTYKIIHSHKIQ